MKKAGAFRLAVFMVSWLAFLPCHSQSTSETEVLALIGAKIYTEPFGTVIADGVVLVKDGKILEVGTGQQVRIPSDARQMDCKGLVMMSGFWNCHVHFMEPQWEAADRIPAEKLQGQMQTMLTRYGFTYAYDLATLDLDNLLKLRGRIESGEVKGPTIFTAGIPFTPPGGSPFYIAPLKLPELATPKEAVDYVNHQLELGADAIKLWFASPDGKKVVPMPLEIVKAATETAHKKGKLVFAHPTNLLGADIASKGGVDVLVHVAADDRKDWSDETLTAMLTSKMALIPTLKLHKWELERADQSAENNPLLNTALQQVRSYNLYGGQILFGTDVGYMSDYSPEDEYVLMAKAGMNYLQILAALTTNPAKRFGLETQTGKIAKGMNADLVLLSVDPAVDSSGFAKIKYTLHHGKIIFQ